MSTVDDAADAADTETGPDDVDVTGIAGGTESGAAEVGPAGADPTDADSTVAGRTGTARAGRRSPSSRTTSTTTTSKSSTPNTGSATSGTRRTPDRATSRRTTTARTVTRADVAEKGSAALRSAGRTGASVVGTALEGARNILARPLASYHLIVTLAVLLTVFGLVMVLSASSVEGYSKEGSSYGPFTTQMIFAVLGAVAFYVMLRMSVRMFRRIAAGVMVVTTVLLALVLIPGIGTLSQGARRWFMISGLSVQPSELVKVALCVWGAHLLASRRREHASLKELLVPLVPVGFLICLLIILEPNLSTTITIAIIIGSLLWFAGLPVKVFASFALAGAVLAVILSLVEGYRSQRVMSFFGHIKDPQGAGYQARQAKFALADGGVFGQGLGQGRAKWNYLPNAKNDFIFAIIGEELGLVGGLLVVALFVILTFVGLRVAMRSADPFLRLMSATITILIAAQAFINIGYVVGVLPVTGIQLPLVSAGGTSTLTVLAMMGLLANAARHEPEAVAALSTGRRGRMTRLLRLPVPVRYRPVEDRGAPLRGGGNRPGYVRRPMSATARPASAQPGRRPGASGRPTGSPAADARPMWRRVIGLGGRPRTDVAPPQPRPATWRSAAEPRTQPSWASDARVGYRDEYSRARSRYPRDSRASRAPSSWPPTGDRAVHRGDPRSRPRAGSRGR